MNPCLLIFSLKTSIANFYTHSIMPYQFISLFICQNKCEWKFESQFQGHYYIILNSYLDLSFCSFQFAQLHFFQFLFYRIIYFYIPKLRQLYLKIFNNFIGNIIYYNIVYYNRFPFASFKIKNIADETYNEIHLLQSF